MVKQDMYPKLSRIKINISDKQNGSLVQEEIKRKKQR